MARSLVRSRRRNADVADRCFQRGQYRASVVNAITFRLPGRRDDAGLLEAVHGAPRGGIGDTQRLADRADGPERVPDKQAQDLVEPRRQCVAEIVARRPPVG